MIMETHYYLINGKVMKGGQMPLSINFRQNTFKYLFDNWNDTLQPCEIDGKELANIKLWVNSWETNNPIEITDIVEDKDGKIYFKQPTEQKIELGDTIEYTIDNKNTPHLHGKTFRVKVASIDENNCYVYAPYGQDIVPIKQAKLINKQHTEKQAESEAMIKYILEIDALTTTEFCNKYNVPKPVFTGEVNSSVNEMLRIDAVKHRMFVQKAKEIFKNR